jgi:hypothetical protein
MTTQASGTPHAAALQASNPGLEIHAHYSRQGATQSERFHLWRNCDRNIRAYWRDHRHLVQAGHLLFLEYDVFCDVDLRSVIQPSFTRFGIAAAQILSGLTDRRSFWPFDDIPKLPRSMQALACATAPLALLLISSDALEAIISPSYDPVFEADIFCELRLPTIIRHAGFSAVSMPIPHVTATPATPDSPGIWHPVKQPVSSSSPMTHDP